MQFVLDKGAHSSKINNLFYLSAIRIIQLFFLLVLTDISNSHIMIAMTKDTYLKAQMTAAEYGWHIYNVEQQKYAIKDYRRLAKKDQLNTTQKVRFAEAHESLEASRLWLRTH